MNYLTLEDILGIRDRTAAACRDRFEIMNYHGLLSALAAPRRSAFGVELFPTLVEKAAALVYALIQNHPFWDGNKRIATTALGLFIRRNGAELVVSDHELEAFTTQIASGALRNGAVAAWIADHVERQT